LGARQKAQDELFKQAVINISIDCKQLERDDEDYIQTNVKIVNQGKRNTFLDFNDFPFRLHKLYFNDAGSTESRLILKQENPLSNSIVLRSGATQEYTVIIKAPEKGFYIVEFLVPLNDTEFKEHKAAGGPSGTIYWGGTASILIK
jgi:hypothetical protein